MVSPPPLKPPTDKCINRRNTRGPPFGAAALNQTYSSYAFPSLGSINPAQQAQSSKGRESCLKSNEAWLSSDVYKPDGICLDEPTYNPFASDVGMLGNTFQRLIFLRVNPLDLCSVLIPHFLDGGSFSALAVSII